MPEVLAWKGMSGSGFCIISKDPEATKKQIPEILDWNIDNEGLVLTD